MTANKRNEYIKTPTGKKMSKVDVYKWKPSGNVGEFHWIDKEDLSVDHEYQRQKLNESRINEFASHWCWIKCGVLSIAIRNNEWYVVDGQHRKLAADKRSDVKKLPCMLFELEGIPKEARAFVDINTNKSAVASFDKFRALIVGEDETAVGLNELFKTTGHYAANSSAIKAITCLMTIWTLFKRDKASLINLWPLITDINEECQIDHRVIRSIWWAEKMLNKVNRTLLEKRISAYLIESGGESIIAEIKRETHIIGQGGFRTETNALLKYINKGKASGKVKLPLIIEDKR
jgi:hypothetical protein